MIDEEFTPRQLELLVEVAKVLEKYDAHFAWEESGCIDINMYVKSEDGKNFDMLTARMPESFSNYDIGEVIDERRQMRALKTAMDKKEKGLFDKLFMLPNE